MVFSTKLPFLRLPMQPHGQSPTSAWTSHAGVMVPCPTVDPVMPPSAPGRRATVRAFSSRGEPPIHEYEPDQHQRMSAQPTRAPRPGSRRRDDRRPEIVAAEGTRCARSSRTSRGPPGRRQVVLREVEVRREVLTERAARREEAERRQGDHDTEEDERMFPRRAASSGLHLLVGDRHVRVVDAQDREVRPLEVGDDAERQTNSTTPATVRCASSIAGIVCERWNGA